MANVGHCDHERDDPSARGVSAADLKDRPAELAAPSMLLRLSLEHDRMFTY